MHTGHQILWAHLVHYRMDKALRANAPLPYPHLVTQLLQHFKVCLTNEPFVKIKHSVAIGVAVVASFGYKKDLDGQWVCKQDHQANAPEERLLIKL